MSAPLWLGQFTLQAYAWLAISHGQSPPPTTVYLAGSDHVTAWVDYRCVTLTNHAPSPQMVSVSIGSSPSDRPAAIRYCALCGVPAIAYAAAFGMGASGLGICAPCAQDRAPEASKLTDWICDPGEWR